MSNDLISREALMERLIPILNEHGDMYFAGKVIEMLNCIPTAFDKERVIDEIKNQLELSDTCAYESDYPTEVSYYKGRTYGHEIDIEIVKKGGIDTAN